MLFISALLMTPSAASAQVQANCEQLSAMEWVVGNWQREEVAERETDTANKGDKRSKQWRFAWTANQNALLITQLATVNAQTVGQLDALFGWDRRKQQIVGSGFSTGGGAGGGWVIDPKTESFTITANRSDWVFEKMSPDTLVVTDKDGVRREFRRLKK